MADTVPQENSTNLLSSIATFLPAAGGLATYLHADSVGAYLPQNIKFRAIADAGYFLDIKTVSGVFLFQEMGKYVYQMQNMSGGVNQNCLEAHLDNEEWRCFFAPYSYPFIKTPIFVLNSVYDTAQLAGILQLGCLPPNCSQEMMEFFDNFRVEFLSQATPAIISTSNGFFGDSCLVHCQTLTDDTWSVYKVSGQLMSETFANWYFGRNGKTRVLDCVYPCNPTCPGVHPLAEELQPPAVGERLF